MTSFKVTADETPINDMAFFLFLADTVIDEHELITPLDLEDIEVENLTLSPAEDHENVNAREEADND